MADQTDSFPGCRQCRHFQGSNKCKAFLNGIPMAIASGDFDHRQPWPGDNGVRFEQKISKRSP